MLSFLLGAGAARMAAAIPEPANMNQPFSTPVPATAPATLEPLMPRADWPQVYRDSIVWDAHACLPVARNGDMSPLERHLKAGATFASVNIAADYNAVGETMHVIAGFRSWIASHPDQYLLVDTLDDIVRAKKEGKLAISFDIEGGKVFGEDLAMVALYRDLGVRQVHMVYNRDNEIGGGCQGAGTDHGAAPGKGLTDFGRAVVKEINRVGMLMDCSHNSKQTSLDICRESTRPVIFSHANVRALTPHPRNIDDEQIKAVMATGGMVAVNGIGVFLGHTIETDVLVGHIDYLVKLVGAEHVGIGLDYMFPHNVDDFPKGEDPGYWWPDVPGFDFTYPDCVPPERLPVIAQALLDRQYSEKDVAAILGGNFMRVAADTWK